VARALIVQYPILTDITDITGITDIMGPIVESVMAKAKDKAKESIMQVIERFNKTPVLRYQMSLKYLENHVKSSM
jgi:hypothetical protein